MKIMRLAAFAASVAVLLVPATSAMADPSPGYEEFSDCPDKSVSTAIALCVITNVEDGHIKLGNTNTPITDPIELVIGVTANDQAFVGNFDGGRQKVPGGLTGISGLDWLTDLFPLGLLEVYAEAELVGPVTNPTGGPIGLPLRIKLDNPLLNDDCYIGSSSNPVQFNLTTGTTDPPPPNEPISGQQGTLTPDPVLPGVFRSTGAILVDNEFAAPAATNCDLLFFGPITALVNHQSGLPSPAGNNETVQEVTGSVAFIQAVYQPDGFEQ